MRVVSFGIQGKSVRLARRSKTKFTKTISFTIRTSDEWKPGFEYTNDHSTARQFFENATISASITSVHKDLIKQFHDILQVIS